MENLIGWKEIPYSDEATDALMELQKGQVLAVRMKAVKNGKVQIEFAEKIDSPNPVRSALGILNKSDDRFNFSSGARRSWETAEPADVESLFGFELPEGEAHSEILEILPNVKGQEFRLQIVEILETEMTDNQVDYADNYLKRAGKDGDYFYTPQGVRVASVISLVTAPVGTEIKHTYIEGAYAPVSSALASAIGKPKEIGVVR